LMDSPKYATASRTTLLMFSTITRRPLAARPA
jgi:hypothetical protein